MEEAKKPEITIIFEPDPDWQEQFTEFVGSVLDYGRAKRNKNETNNEKETRKTGLLSPPNSILFDS